MTAAFVQVKTGNGNTQFVATHTVFDDPSVAGNLIIAIAEWSFSGDSAAISFSSDPAGITFNPATPAIEVASFKNCRMFYGYAAASTQYDIILAATGIAGEQSQITILEYSGVTGAPEASSTSGTTDANCAITTLSDHALVVATGIAFSDPGVGSGWTGRAHPTTYTDQRVVDLLDATPVGTFTGQFTSADAKCAAAFALPATGQPTARRFGQIGRGFGRARPGVKISAPRYDLRMAA